MMLMLAWAFMSLTAFLTPIKYLWHLSVVQAFIIAVESVRWVFMLDHPLNHLFFIDNISGPLVLLTTWLLPLTLLASQGKLKSEPPHRQRLFITSITASQVVTFLAFTSSSALSFFIFYEATLIPMVFIIARWGTQERRFEAGMYFMFYTMLGAIPLLLCLLQLHHNHGSLSFALLNLLPPIKVLHPNMYWTICNTAFLIKLPLFCLHLWLPKAHVEAPVAGSMILAGTLLKLGGYGILRASMFFTETPINYTLAILLIATFGVLATAMLCLRQTDFKSLIAMSSVSHMNLFIIAALISTPTSYTGAIIMMIAHGLTSSAMFCLVNLAYERTNSRTMILLRGASLIFPLTGLWWLLTSLANMALPPSINFAGELMIMLAIHIWSPIMFLIVALNLIFTTAYTLYIFWSTQRDSIPHHLLTLPPILPREHILLALHLIPLLLLMIKPELLY